MNKLHPGYHLKLEIKFRNLSKKKVAEELGIKPSHLSEIFSGKRNITPKIAIMLESILDYSASRWLSLQNKYYLDRARKKLTL